MSPKKPKKKRFAARPYKPRKPKKKKRRTDEEILTAARNTLKAIKARRKSRRTFTFSKSINRVSKEDSWTELRESVLKRQNLVHSYQNNYGTNQFHRPVSISEHPTIPMGFTSVATGEAELGELYVSDIFYVVCEKRPLCLTQIASISAGKGIDPALIDTLYSASVYYKKSLNPIGPSSLPIHVFSMAFTNTELSMKPRGLWAKITGKPFEPEMVMLMHYSADGVKIVGSLDNDFDRQTAYKTMIFKVCEELVMHRNEFKHLGNLKDFGPDSPAIQ